jgi:hypothetical protein
MVRHLSTLRVLHYVYGALICAIGFGLLGFVFIGHFLQGDWIAEHAQGDPPPYWVGSLVQAMGWALFALCELKGALNIVSGKLIGERRGRTFTLVVAALDCLSPPLGMALGIFTFITLEKEEVRQAYDASRGMMPGR